MTTPTIIYEWTIDYNDTNGGGIYDSIYSTHLYKDEVARQVDLYNYRMQCDDITVPEMDYFCDIYLSRIEPFPVAITDPEEISHIIENDFVSGIHDTLTEAYFESEDYYRELDVFNAHGEEVPF